MVDGRGCVNPETPPLLTSISFCICSAGEVVALVGCSSLVCDCMFLFDAFDALFDVAAVFLRYRRSDDEAVPVCPSQPWVEFSFGEV